MEQQEGVAIPIVSSQIAAANRIYSLTRQWQATVRAFSLLYENAPGFDMQAVLLKVAAVNQLYYTNVYAVGRMAEHVVRVMGDPPKDTPAVVEAIATLPLVPGQKSIRRYWSFASKFAHFFIAPERFPMYDQYAAAMVRYHLGPKALIMRERSPYRPFAENVRRLRSLNRLGCSVEELDRYLWLSGVYRKFLKEGPEAPINAEVQALLKDPSPEVEQALAELLPTSAHAG